jgi:hypothetical protein
MYITSWRGEFGSVVMIEREWREGSVSVGDYGWLLVVNNTWLSGCRVAGALLHCT